MPIRFPATCLHFKVLVCLLVGIVFGFHHTTAVADSTWVYAVQLSASVQDSPPQITLNWRPDPYGASSYRVYRKAKDDTSWGNPVAVLSGSVTSYTDNNVGAGQSYEYQVAKDAMLGYHGYGYLFSGIYAPATESRGTVVLVVASNIAGTLGPELARLQADLAGDGWQVVRHDVSVDATPASVRDLIRTRWHGGPGAATGA